MNKAVIALLGSVALIVSSASIAGKTTTIAPDNMDANNAAGFYISGNLGYGNVDVNLPSVAGVSTSHRGVAWSTAVGYQFNPYVAVEGGYIQFADEKVSVPGSSVTVTTEAADLAVKGIYPINQQFNVFGKAGIAYMTHTGVISGGGTTVIVADTDHQVVPLFGAGASYNIDENWAVGVQAITTLKSGDNFPATYTGLVGVTYKFS